MQPVTRTLPCQPKVRPEMQGCGQALGFAQGLLVCFSAPSSPSSVPSQTMAQSVSLRFTPWRLQVTRRRSEVLWPPRAAACLTSLQPQLGHRAPHASSLVRGTLPPRGPGQTVPSAWDAPPPVGCGELTAPPPGLCHSPASPRPTRPARRWQPAPPCPAGPLQGPPPACMLCESFATTFDLHLSSQLERKPPGGPNRCPN